MIKNFFTICLLSLIIGGCDSNTSKIVETAETPVATLTPSKTSKREAKPFDPQRDIGIIRYGGNCMWLTILNDTLIPGDAVQIVKIEHPQKISSAKIVEPVDCPDSKGSGMGEFIVDSESEEEAAKYQIEFVEKGNESDYHLAIAVVNTPSNIVVKNGIVELDISGEDPLRFHQCYSNEGVHLTVWEGKPLVGNRLWHGYQHFLYDVEPSCRHEQETKFTYLDNN